LRVLFRIQQIFHSLPVCFLHRQYLLKHFGEKETNPKTVCGGTCDFCCNPDKVTSAIEQANRAIASSSFRVSKGSPGGWDGQWAGPHDDDGEDFGDDGGFDARHVACGLSITGGNASDDFSSLKSPSKRPASAVLAKFEVSTFCLQGLFPYFSLFVVLTLDVFFPQAIECRHQKNGFVHFKKKEAASTRDIVKVPDHLKQIAASSAANRTIAPKAPPPKEKTSSELCAEAERLRKELEELKADKEDTKGDAKGAARPPPPPPPISFQKKKRRG